jgi:hypothetical protein
VAPAGLEGALDAVTLADGLGVGVPVGEAVGAVEAVGVAEGTGVALRAGAGVGVWPEPELAGKAVKRELVDA